jgi:eukaryotic-like serine/threonine-protein kinase
VTRAPLKESDPSRVGRYRITARLGAGGMGVVYLGSGKDGRPVAVKVLRPELAEDEELRVRFRREVATLLQVRGACTVRVIEADTEAPRPFLVTEYVAGPSLAEHVAANGPLDAGMVQGLAVGLAEALTAIHGVGVVHRDLKPSNVLLASDGPKVIDFGIAQALDSTAVTRTGVTVGSAGFMAPEQVMGNAGPKADIFAWALTIAYAASGQPPFGTGPTDAVLYRILHAEPDTAAVPAALRPVLLRALAKNPVSRPAASDLLEQLTAGETAAGSGFDTPTQTVLSRTWQLAAPGYVAPAVTHRSRRRPAVLLAAACIAAAAAGGTAVALATTRNPADARPAAVLPPHPGAALTVPARTPAPLARSAAADTSAAPPTLPVVTIGAYTGTDPAEIDFSGDAGNLVTGIEWVSWTETGATGYGTSEIDNCNPDCAQGTSTQVLAEIILSRPRNGRFAAMAETRNGTTATLVYPSVGWPIGAS